MTPSNSHFDPPPWVGRSIFLGRNHPQICRDLCKSASMIPSRTKFKVWGVTLLTRWGQYCLGRNVRHCGKVSKCEFSSFTTVVGFNLPTLPHTRVTTFVSTRRLLLVQTVFINQPRSVERSSCEPSVLSMLGVAHIIFTGLNF